MNARRSKNHDGALATLDEQIAKARAKLNRLLATRDAIAEGEGRVFVGNGGAYLVLDDGVRHTQVRVKRDEGHDRI